LFYLFPIFSMNLVAFRLSFHHPFCCPLRSAFQNGQIQSLSLELFSPPPPCWQIPSGVSAGCKVKKSF
jgi:hypothetical protein